MRSIWALVPVGTKKPPLVQPERSNTAEALGVVPLELKLTFWALEKVIDSKSKNAKPQPRNIAELCIEKREIIFFSTLFSIREKMLL